MKLPKLLASQEYGEGDIRMPDDWTEHNGLLRADILKDWIGLLEEQYLIAMNDWRDELEENKERIKNESAKINS